jgi:hypothetical protein
MSSPCAAVVGDAPTCRAVAHAVRLQQRDRARARVDNGAGSPRMRTSECATSRGALRRIAVVLHLWVCFRVMPNGETRGDRRITLRLRRLGRPRRYGFSHGAHCTRRR